MRQKKIQIIRKNFSMQTFLCLFWKKHVTHFRFELLNFFTGMGLPYWANLLWVKTTVGKPKNELYNILEFLHILITLSSSNLTIRFDILNII